MKEIQKVVQKLLREQKSEAGGIGSVTVWLVQLEIVDQWSTRIPPPHRRGWQWAMGGLQLNIVQNHKAAILKAT